jgi:chemotaxis protein methyltransferase CheR
VTSSLCVNTVRRQLEAAYGLALDGLEPGQISAAVAAATGEGLGAEDPRFLARVVDHLPIDESWLFREDALWEWLRGALPSLLERALAGGRPARVLSIGCSSGQEPFSAAILLQGLAAQAGIPASAAAYPQIVGLDPSPARILAARAGAVASWSVQRCRPDWLQGRVAPDESAPGRWVVDPSVRAMCRFEVGNLVDVAQRGNAALAGYDLVLCRHVLIYFKPAEAERLAGLLARGLDPGAVLAFSAAEAHLVAASGLEPLAYLGAGRASRAAAAPALHRRARAAALPPATAARRTGALRAAVPPRARADGRGERIARHVHVALEHAVAGRGAEALREARAALLHDPRHLYSRMLLGRQLIDVDAARGREVLRDLLASASSLPEDAAVPCADGLSVGQLAAAVRLLLDGRAGGAA